MVIAVPIASGIKRRYDNLNILHLIKLPSYNIILICIERNKTQQLPHMQVFNPICSKFYTPFVRNTTVETTPTSDNLTSINFS